MANKPLTRERQEYLFRIGKAVADCIHQKQGSILRPEKAHLKFASKQLDLRLSDIEQALDYFNFGHYN